jgi:crotonobetainyl-CoA:carnitine CoA-transferase CaiB-like acyl-CoA transferase
LLVTAFRRCRSTNDGGRAEGRYPPPRTALSIGDSLAGMFAAQGVLTALYARDRAGGAAAGRGQVVDVSLAES